MSCRELRNGRRFSQRDGEIQYYIDGAPDEADAMGELILGSPASVTIRDEGSAGDTIILARQLGECSVEARALVDDPDGDPMVGIWTGTAKYALPASAGRPVPVVGEKVVSFSIGRATRTARQALSSTLYSSNGSGQLITQDYPARTIGFDAQAGTAQGCEVSYPVFSITVAAYFTAAQFSAAYRGHLREISDAPLNNGTFIIYGLGSTPAQSAFFEGFEAVERGAEKDWEVRWSFKVAYAANLSVKFVGDTTAVNVPVGGFEVVDMVYYEDVKDDGIILTPNYAVVHKIYNTSDFGYLQPGYSPGP